MKHIIITCMISFLLPGFVNAAQGTRTGIITLTQVTNSTASAYPSSMFIVQSGTWSGVNCPGAWGYFNAKDNPHLAATAIAARLNNIPVTVTVDDHDSGGNGYCEIIDVLF